MIKGHAELLEQIRNARDDAPYLVYADLIEQNGDEPRAMLIRYQCELAKLPPWHQRHRELTWQIDDLVAAHGARWRAELPVLDGVTWTAFERGFVSAVRVRDVPALYRNALAIAEAAPVTCVELEQINERRTPPPEAIPWLRRVCLLSLRDAHFDEKRSLLALPAEIELREIDEYGSTPKLAAAIRMNRTTPLERLIVSGEHTTAAYIVRNLGSLDTSQLRELRLGTEFIDEDTGYFGDPTLRDTGARILAERIARVEVLDVAGQRVRNSGLAALLANARLRELDARACEITKLDLDDHPYLTALDLGHNAIGNAGAAAIAGAARFARLESLELDRCEIGGAGVAALAEAPFWHALHRLDLGENPLGVEGAVALAAAPDPEQLRTLDLANADLTVEATALLADLPWLRRLRAIELSKNAVAPSLLETIAAGDARDVGLAHAGIVPAAASALAGLFPRVQHLRLAGNPLRDAGLAALIGDGELATLDLRNCELGDASLRRITELHWPHLRSLLLSGNAFTRAGIAALIRSPLVAQLRRLALASCGLDESAATLIATTPALGGLAHLNLGGNKLSERMLLAIARSEELRSIERVLVTPSERMPNAVVEELNKRFGYGWQWWSHDDDDFDPDMN